jgi:hypothetical protein
MELNDHENSVKDPHPLLILVESKKRPIREIIDAGEGLSGSESSPSKRSKESDFPNVFQRFGNFTVVVDSIANRTGIK